MKGHTLLKCFFFTFLGYDGPPGWVEESFAAYLHVCLFFFMVRQQNHLKRRTESNENSVYTILIDKHLKC